MDELFGHPGIGASWETFVLEQVRQLKPAHLDLYFYRTHQGAEADLVLAKGSTPVACIEVKLSTSPQVSKGFYQTIADLKTKRKYVVVPAGESYAVHEKTTVCSLKEFVSDHLEQL